jgi:hypothetical protein
MNEFLLNRRMRQICLEGPILLGTPQRLDDGLGGESVPEGIAP